MRTIIAYDAGNLEQLAPFRTWRHLFFYSKNIALEIKRLIFF